MRLEKGEKVKGAITAHTQWIVSTPILITCIFHISSFRLTLFYAFQLLVTGSQSRSEPTENSKSIRLTVCQTDCVLA